LLVESKNHPKFIKLRLTFVLSAKRKLLFTSHPFPHPLNEEEKKTVQEFCNSNLNQFLSNFIILIYEQKETKIL